MFSLLAIPFFAIIVAGSPTKLATRDVCNTVLAGYLAADVNGNLKTFRLNSQNAISYTGDGSSPLQIEFQLCDNLVNHGSPNEDTEIPGRIYVPSQAKCIAITNQEDDTGPYSTTLASCNTDYPQRWLVRELESNAVYWSGESDEEGSMAQGGCGLLTYESAGDGTPTTHGDSEVSVVCGGTPFKISDSPA